MHNGNVILFFEQEPWQFHFLYFEYAQWLYYVFWMCTIVLPCFLNMHPPWQYHAVLNRHHNNTTSFLITIVLCFFYMYYNTIIIPYLIWKCTMVIQCLLNCAIAISCFLDIYHPYKKIKASMVILWYSKIHHGTEIHVPCFLNLPWYYVFF